MPAETDTATGNLPVDGGRLWSDLMALAAITDPDKPYTRRSFSPRFDEGRAWLVERFEQAGLKVRLDAGGNLFGRLEGSDPEAGTILIGSHSDSVPSGGRFDGPAGLLTGLEVLRSVQARHGRLRHALEVVDFLAEEPSEFGLSCIGSRSIAGVFAPEMFDYRDPSGETLRHAISRVGGDPDHLAQARRHDIAAFFELHIEQGVVLERGKIDVGIVTGLVGIIRIEIVFEGRADHAGTTPMDLRRDAGLAAGLAIAWIGEDASARAAQGRGHFVATCGVVEFTPNAANIIPARARLVIDIRAEDQAFGHDFVEALEAHTRHIAQRCRVAREGWRILSESSPVACDPGLRASLTQSAQDLGFSSLPMASGAGHDAGFMARITRSALVFVPCRDGRSHTPEEWADQDAIAAGAAVICKAVLDFDRLSGAAPDRTPAR